MIKKAVIPCGGCGTRFLPVTKAIAKEMLPIVDRPCLDYIVEELTDSGIREILLIVSPDKPEISRFYSPNERLNARLSACPDKKGVFAMLERLETQAKFSYAIQEEAKGSGHAMMLAEEFADGEPFAIALGDDLMAAQKPVTAQLIETFDRYGKTVHGVQEREVPEILRYGVAVVSRELGGGAYEMKGIMEKPSEARLPSRLAGLGRYVVTPDIFDYIRKTPYAPNGELQFTDALDLQAREQGAVAQVFEGKRYDIGDKLGSLEAIVETALRRDDLGERFRAYLRALDLN